MSPSPSETPTLDSKLKFDFDELGNVSVCVEDQEGNLVSEVIDDLKELDEGTKELLRVDNLSSLPENTGVLVRKIITEKMTRINPISRNRSQIKARVLGSNINFEYDTSSPPILSSRALAAADQQDGMSRRKASQSQHIERLLYPLRFEGKSEGRRTDPVVARTDFQLCQQDKPLPYSQQFNFSVEPRGLQEMGGTVPAEGPAECEASAPLTLILHNSILVPLRHYVLYRRFTRDSLRPSLKMLYNGINIIIYHIYIHIWVIGTTKKTYQDTPDLQNPISGA